MALCSCKFKYRQIKWKDTFEGCAIHLERLSRTIIFLIRLGGGGVQLGPLGTAATDWPVVACPG
jgi:hypothetical protein